MDTPQSPVAPIGPEIARDGAGALRPLLLAEPSALPLSPGPSDYDLNPDLKRAVPHELVPSAVLIPIVRRADPTVLFTRRTETLARHAGQVSFPGGRLETDDASLVFTALRETQEETGIDPALVTVAGFLDPYETGTGFAILPVIGVLEEGFGLSPNVKEVAEIFEVPLAFLLDPANCKRETTEWRGSERAFYAFHYKQHHIWGATAAIIVSLRDRLRA
ncbi:MAG TPA: CoA pyrophosphatase [Rhizomicrobium sp.]|jgi:8-oxo-dGTP pyrophosphatase MutT (NUDIX family)